MAKVEGVIPSPIHLSHPRQRRLRRRIGVGLAVIAIIILWDFKEWWFQLGQLLLIITSAISGYLIPRDETSMWGLRYSFERPLTRILWGVAAALPYLAVLFGMQWIYPMTQEELLQWLLGLTILHIGVEWATIYSRQAKSTSE